MKKIMINAIVTPNDDGVTLENLKDALRHLGAAYFTYIAEVELASAEELTKEVWLYDSGDESEPYIQVGDPCQTEGRILSKNEVDQMRENGVCTQFRAEYPRADKNPAPLYACDDNFAEALVGEHLFKVNVDGLIVHAFDRGDDGREQIWLKIALPE